MTEIELKEYLDREGLVESLAEEEALDPFQRYYYCNNIFGIPCFFANKGNGYPGPSDRCPLIEGKVHACRYRKGVVYLKNNKPPKLELLKWFKDEYSSPHAFSAHANGQLEESSRKFLTKVFIDYLEKGENKELVEKHKDTFDRIYERAEKAWEQRRN